jgi:WD40 repeat protein
MKLFRFNRLVICSCVLVSALCVSASAERMYQLNNSVVIQTTSPAGDITVESYSVPSLADFDGDGLIDLVVGEATGLTNLGKVRFYRNIGTAAPVYGGFVFAQTGSGDLTVPRYSCLGIFPRMVDWDLDGDLDLLAGIGDGTVKIFLNIGTKTNPMFDAGTLLAVGPAGSKVTLDVGDRATPSLVDWNNDGKRDLIVGAMDGQIRVYINQGSDSAPDHVVVGGLLIQAAGTNIDVATAPAPLPGISTVTAAGPDHRRLEGKLSFSQYRTDAARLCRGEFLTAGGAIIDLVPSRSRPFVCDYNLDGRLDVLVGVSDGKVYLFTSISAIPLGGKRLAQVQNNDGGWDWPLDDGNPLAGSDSETLGSIGLGLACAYNQTGDPDLPTRPCRPPASSCS